MKQVFVKTPKFCILLTIVATQTTQTWANEQSLREHQILAQPLSAPPLQFGEWSKLNISFDTSQSDHLQSPTLYNIASNDTFLQKPTTILADSSQVLEPITIIGTPPKRYEATTSTSATGIEADLNDIPRSIQVINEQVILDQGAQDLRGVLKNVSGVRAGNISGGTNDVFILRGIEVQNINQDGFQLSRNSQRVQTANIERVEVVKGPNAILTGTGAPGGVINVITKRPQADPRHTLTYSFDEFGKKDLLFDTTGKVNESETLLYRFVASTEDSDTFRKTDKFANIKRDLIAPSLTWFASDSDTFDVSMEYLDSTLPFDNGTVVVRDNDGNLSIANDNRAARFDEDIDRSKSSQLTTKIEYEHLFDNNWALDADLHYQSIDVSTVRHNPSFSLNAPIDPTIPFPEAVLQAITSVDTADPNQFSQNAVFRDQGVLVRAPAGGEGEQQRFRSTLRLSGDVDWGEVQHRLLFGLDYSHLKSDAKILRALFETSIEDTSNPGNFITLPNFSGINIFAPVYGQSNPFPLTETGGGITKDTQFGLYAQDLISVGEDWIFLIGLRVDRYKRDSTTTNLFFLDQIFYEEFSTPNVADRSIPTDYETSPNAGIIYHPTEQLSLFASYSESFVPSAATSSNGEVFNVPPSEGEQIELGLKGELLDGKMVFNIAWFEIIRSNVISGANLDGTPIVNGEETSRGVELDTNVQFFKGFNLIFNYAYIDAEITGGTSRVGNVPENVPEHAANLWLTKEFISGPLRGLGLGGGATYVGKRFVDSANTFETDAYTTFDITTFYYLPVFTESQIRFQLSVNNLTDEEFYLPFDNSLRIGVGAPRTITASLGFEF